MRPLLRLTLLPFLFALTIFPLHARVTRVETTSRRDVLGGKAFGDEDEQRLRQTLPSQPRPGTFHHILP